MIVKSAAKLVSNTRSNPRSRRARTSLPVETEPGASPNSSPSATRVAGATCTIVVWVRALSAERTSRQTDCSVSAPVGHTSVHCPQLMHCVSARARSNAVVCSMPAPRSTMPKMYCSCPPAPHTSTQRLQSMHLSTSRSIATEVWSWACSRCESAAPRPRGVTATLAGCSSFTTVRRRHSCSTSHRMQSSGCRDKSISTSRRRYASTSGECVCTVSPSESGVAHAGRSFPLTSTRHTLSPNQAPGIQSAVDTCPTRTAQHTQTQEGIECDMRHRSSRRTRHRLDLSVDHEQRSVCGHAWTVRHRSVAWHALCSWKGPKSGSTVTIKGRVRRRGMRRTDRRRGGSSRWGSSTESESRSPPRRRLRVVSEAAPRGGSQ
eukprot:m.351874 g.351874  ORF g.351874 m.351874 type:complete len:376 (-) comp27983_c0_seq3:368-1495(-)